MYKKLLVAFFFLILVSGASAFCLFGLVGDCTQDIFIPRVRNADQITYSRILDGNTVLSEFLAETIKDGYLTNNGDPGFPNVDVNAVEISITGALSININSMTAFVDGNVFLVDSLDVVLTDNTHTFIYVRNNGTNAYIVSASDPQDQSAFTFALVGEAFTAQGEVIHVHEHPPIKRELAILNKNIDLVFGTAVISGLLLSVNTASTDFNVTTGSWLLNFQDLHELADLYPTLTKGVTWHFHSGGVETQTKDNSGLNFTQWDDGTDLTATNAGKWYTDFIFVLEHEMTNDANVHIVIADTEHNLQSVAEIEEFVAPLGFSGVAVPIARIVRRGNQIDFSSLDSFTFVQDIRPIFRAGGDGGVSGGGALQNIWATFDSDSGSTTANTTADTITILGTANQTDTSIIGDTLTIALPQDIHTGAEPVFSGLTINGNTIFNFDTTEFMDIDVTRSGSETTQVIDLDIADSSSGNYNYVDFTAVSSGTGNQTLLNLQHTSSNDGDAQGLFVTTVSSGAGDSFALQFEASSTMGGDVFGILGSAGDVFGQTAAVIVGAQFNVTSNLVGSTSTGVEINAFGAQDSNFGLKFSGNFITGIDLANSNLINASSVNSIDFNAVNDVNSTRFCLNTTGICINDWADVNQAVNGEFVRSEIFNASFPISFDGNVSFDSNVVLDGRYILISDSNNTARLLYSVIANPPHIPTESEIDANALGVFHDNFVASFDSNFNRLAWDTDFNSNWGNRFNLLTWDTDFNSNWSNLFSTKDTDDLTEGSSNLYFTDARATNNFNSNFASVIDGNIDARVQGAGQDYNILGSWNFEDNLTGFGGPGEIGGWFIGRNADQNSIAIFDILAFTQMQGITLTTIDANTNIIPFLDSVFDLGSDLLRWANIYADTITSGTFTDGTATLTGGTLTGASISADQLTPGTFGSGNYVFPGNLAVTGTISDPDNSFITFLDNIRLGAGGQIQASDSSVAMTLTGVNVAFGGTIDSGAISATGSSNFDTDSGNDIFFISRAGGINEAFKFWVDDIDGYIIYKQDVDGDADHTLYITNEAGGTGDNSIVFQTSGDNRFKIADGFILFNGNNDADDDAFLAIETGEGNLGEAGILLGEAASSRGSKIYYDGASNQHLVKVGLAASLTNAITIEASGADEGDITLHQNVFVGEKLGVATTSIIEQFQVGDNSNQDIFMSFQTSNGHARGINYYLTDGTSLRGYVFWDSLEDLNLKGDEIHFDVLGKDDALVLAITTGNATFAGDAIFDGGNIGLTGNTNIILMEPTLLTISEDVLIQDSPGGTTLTIKATTTASVGSATLAFVADTGTTSLSHSQFPASGTNQFNIMSTDKVLVATSVTGASNVKLTVGGTDGGIAITDGITAPSTAGAYAQIYVDTADGDLKVKFGNGFVATIATDS